MQIHVKDLRTGRVRSMDKKFADILVKLKKVSYEIPDDRPYTGPVYNTAVMKAEKPKAKKDAKEKKPKKEKKKKEAKAKTPKETPAAADKKEYLTKVMTAEE